MEEKQKRFQEEADDLRAALCREPRGHRNMLGAIITDPVSDDAVVGVLFTSPDGYFEMCGDSSISLGSYLADSGLVARPNGGSGTVEAPVDTVAGRVVLKLRFEDSHLVDTTVRNVGSYLVQVGSLEVDGCGTLRAEIGYGGLTYAFFDAEDLGFSTLLLEDLSEDERTRLIDTGTTLWQAAQAADFERPIDLITISELPDVAGFRVANFYAPATMGRTPSGTGLSGHIGVEHGLGRIAPGQSIVHESILGLRFTGLCLEQTTSEASESAVVPEISARSYLMGVQQVFFEEDDPFQGGFKISA